MKKEKINLIGDLFIMDEDELTAEEIFNAIELEK